jgi:hypothetical protein
VTFIKLVLAVLGAVIAGGIPVWVTGRGDSAIGLIAMGTVVAAFLILLVILFWPWGKRGAR